MEKIIYSKSFIDFLKKSDCKVAKILYRLNLKRYTPLMVTSCEVNCLTFRGDGTISYLPKGKECIYNDSGDWSKENRQNGKPSKIIRKLFAARAMKILQIKDADFECFTNAYKAEFNDGGYKFWLLKNTEIPNVYEMERGEGEGSLNNSCMNGDSEYLDIYKYCSQLSILTLKNNDNLLCGRALVWKISDDITLMDRIYVTEDFMYDKFISYGILQNWWRKKDYKSYDNKTTFINTNGEEINQHFKIITDTSFDSYPYIDTFQYGDDGSLNNSGDGEYTYNCTNGEREGGEDNHDGEVYCESRGEYINEDDAIYIENGERRYRDEYHHANDCICVNDNWYHEDDINIVEVNNTWYTKDSDELCEIDGEYYLQDDCTYCERDNSFYLSSDCVYCEDDEEDVLLDEAVEIDGKYYHKESDLIFEHNGKYYLEDTGVEA